MQADNDVIFLINILNTQLNKQKYTVFFTGPI
jgi:hypothetical protein